MNDELLRLERWANLVRKNLDTGDQLLEREAIHIILDLSRDAAHQVIRAASPVTLFLVGVAVGRGETLGKVAAKVTQLALAYEDLESDGSATTEPEEAPLVGDIEELEFPATSND